MRGHGRHETNFLGVARNGFQGVSAGRFQETEIAEDGARKGERSHRHRAIPSIEGTSDRLCGICSRLQHLATADRKLVMRLGQRFESARRLLIFAEIGEPHKAEFGGSLSPAIDDSCDDNSVWTTVNSRAHVWFTIRSSTLISVQSGAAVNTSILTENHGVPGSNPGPATQENPANKELWRCCQSPLSRACQQPDQE